MLRRSLASPGCALHGAPQLIESASGLFGDAAADVLTGWIAEQVLALRTHS